MSITKKPFIAIAVVISAFALVLVYAKGLDLPPAFADENFKASVTESWPGEKLTAKDVSELRSLDFFKEENIGSFEDLKMFTSLEYLSLQGFSVHEVNSILENCPNTLDILIIEGDEGYPIADSFLSAAKNLRVSASESVGIYKLGQDTDVACTSISVDAYRIDGVNNITQLKNMDSIELKTEFGFDKPLDCALFAENSPELSELIITNGNLSNVESLASLHNLKTLMLTDTDIKNTAWAEALSGEIEHMIIMEYGKALVKNVFED